MAKSITKTKVKIIQHFECGHCGEEFNTQEEAEQCFDSHNNSYCCQLCKSETIMDISDYKNDDGEIIQIISQEFGHIEHYFCHECIKRLCEKDEKPKQKTKSS